MAAGAALEALITPLLGPDPRRTREVGELTGLWRGALHGKDAVVILDNAAGAEQVRPLLPGDGSCAGAGDVAAAVRAAGGETAGPAADEGSGMRLRCCGRWRGG